MRVVLGCRSINEATKAIPIIGDGDTGYGNALNVKRTVRGFAGAGFAGILIEDQASHGLHLCSMSCIMQPHLSKTGIVCGWTS